MKHLLTIASLVFLASCGPTQEDAPLGLVESLMADDTAIARGGAIFEGTCANFCHGLTPEIAADDYPGPPNLFDCEWLYGGTDDEIFATVVSGIPGTRMVGFGSNFPEGDSDLWKVIAFLRTNQPTCEADSQDQITE